MKPRHLLMAGVLAALMLTGSCLKGDVSEQTAKPVKLPEYSKPVVDSSMDGLLPGPGAATEAEDPGQPGTDESGDPDQTEPADDPAPDEPIDPAIDASIDGQELYRQSQCAMCHAPDRGDQQLGPELENLQTYWNVTELARFLRRPADYAADSPRLIEVGRRYRLVMPASSLSDEELLALAAWVLNEFE